MASIATVILNRYLEARAFVESARALPFGEGPKAVARLSFFHLGLSKSDFIYF